MSPESKMAQLFFFLVVNVMLIPNLYSYIKLSFVFEVCCIFYITTLCFWKIWCAYGGFMQNIFSQTEYSMKTKFCSLPKDGVQHLQSVKPSLIWTKYYFYLVDNFKLIPNMYSYIGFFAVVKTLLNFI